MARGVLNFHWRSDRDASGYWVFPGDDRSGRLFLRISRLFAFSQAVVYSVSMSQADQTIEAEVVEIDGVTVEPRPTSKQGAGDKWKDLGKWQMRVKNLDPRWWPLWAALGFIALVLIVSVGMCVAVVWIAYRIVVGITSGFLSLFVPSRELQRR